MPTNHTSSLSHTEFNVNCMRTHYKHKSTVWILQIILRINDADSNAPKVRGFSSNSGPDQPYDWTSKRLEFIVVILVIWSTWNWWLEICPPWSMAWGSLGCSSFLATFLNEVKSKDQAIWLELKRGNYIFLEIRWLSWSRNFGFLLGGAACCLLIKRSILFSQISEGDSSSINSSMTLRERAFNLSFWLS